MATVATKPIIKIDIKPQPGPQMAFMSSSADIAIYGGAAGSGKTYALLLEPLRNINNGRFGCVIFRRESPQIRAEGALWDESQNLYRGTGATPREGMLDWVFPSGAKVKFAHLQMESDIHGWDGSQICLICFDQLEAFTKKQFFYMLSRNRSTCGIAPYIRAACNPDPDSFLRSFLAWWIDDITGLPIPERSGVIRWFVHIDNQIYWADTAAELESQFGSDCAPKSCTFISANVYDNKILLDKNPGYLSNLKALQKIDRERLLYGNWNARATAGMYFKREWLEVVDAAPIFASAVRYWDRAATAAEVGKEVKASFTAGIRLQVDSKGIYYVYNSTRFQGSPLTVKSTIKNVASQDGRPVRIGIEQDPGQAGKAEAEDHVRNLAGYNVTINPVHEAKGVRVKPFSAQCEAGNVKIIRGDWNEAFLNELENFDGSSKCVSDQVDACSGAFTMLTNKKRAGWLL
jgi:predicted phage terminase large subunit-like protein